MKNSDEQKILISIYYMIILKNDINLEIQECEMKNEISTALKNHWFLDATLYDLINDKHEVLFFHHSATIEIRRIYIMLNALISVQSWDAVEVLKKKELIFSQNLRQV